MTEQVRYRIPKKLVVETRNIFKELGTTPSQAVSMFFAQVIKLRGFPFQPSLREISIYGNHRAGLVKDLGLLGVRNAKKNRQNGGSGSDLWDTIAGEKDLRKGQIIEVCYGYHVIPKNLPKTSGHVVDFRPNGKVKHIGGDGAVYPAMIKNHPKTGKPTTYVVAQKSDGTLFNLEFKTRGQQKHLLCKLV